MKNAETEKKKGLKKTGKRKRIQKEGVGRGRKGFEGSKGMR